MSGIDPVFPVFDISRAKAEQVLADAEQVHGGDLDQLGADITILHPVYREMMIGVRQEGTSGRRYAVMLLETDRSLYDRARIALTSK